MKVYPCTVPGHEGYCTPLHSDLFRSVSRKWYWPVYRAYGLPFCGQYNKVARVVTKLYEKDSSPALVAAASAVRRPAQATRVDEYPSSTAEENAHSPGYYRANEAPSWPFPSAPAPFRSGRGGDFGGGGAEGSWENEQPKPATQTAASSDPPAPAPEPISAPIEEQSCRASDYSSPSSDSSLSSSTDNSSDTSSSSDNSSSDNSSSSSDT